MKFSPLILPLLLLSSSDAFTALHTDTRRHSTRLNLERGDTRGAVLLLEDVALSRGSNQLLQDITLRVENKERWGIVGPNGAGKSTLLGSIMGQILPDEGKALIGPKVRVGYLKQTAVSGSTRTVGEEAASEMEDINTAKARMEAAQVKIEKGDTSAKTLDELSTVTQEFQRLGGYQQEQLVDSVLGGLGFQPGDSGRLCSDFSGGWQMRIALARLLLSRPSLLLLDEPSNHLDSSARDWLAKYLSNYDGSIVLVSHDISLLEKSVNSIAEISGGTLLKYVSCTYSKYLDEKEFRAKSAAAEYERNMEEASRLQAWVDKYGASATKASAAQSRVKTIERMRKEGKLTPPPVAVVSKVKKPELVLPDPPKPVGEVLMSLKNASIGYEKEAPPILQHVDLTITRGMKLVLRGPNGAGKSTLMAALRGKIDILEGEKELNRKLRLGVFTQDLAQELDGEERAIDIVTQYAREGDYGDITVSDQQARGVLGRLGLGDDKPLRYIKDLSGGEKARVALGMFGLKSSNCLFLDEPSNHLDVECISALSAALSNWGGKDGALVVISHDRSFCEAIGFTHVGTVTDGGFTIEERDLKDSDWAQYDLASRGEESTAKNGNSFMGRKEIDELSPEELELQKKRRKQAYNAPKRIAKIEKEIEKIEEKVNVFDEEMVVYGTNVDKLKEIMEKKESEERKLVKLMEEWEDLELILAEFPR